MKYNLLLYYKKKLVLGFLLLMQFSAFSQLEVVVVNMETKEPIPYASIYLKNTENGTNSNLDGRFKLLLNQNDTLMISSIGYKNVEFPYSSIEDTLFLEEDIKQMSELIVTSDRSLKIFPARNVIGELKSSFFTDNYWLGAGGRPYKIARLFQYENRFEETRFLESITLETLSYINGAKFSINFFTKGLDGMPKDPLLKDYIVFDCKKNRSKVKIPLLDYNIYFPKKGIFVVIQFLSIDQNRSIRDIPLKYAEKEYQYKYNPSFSLVKTESPSLYTYINKAQKWVLSKNKLREIEAELVLIE
ncbi:CarboxypepD_reg-like domain-containing protein [Marivirga sericea]|uniref:CarboxypepD_reg-like domain-containing protein n=1 Tax=Marivirga sericea TaxID=1028 RepID=A0A1X7IKD2_9BACT|nr:CarboxypepD_reg-like domain-containing protein [Marivirga sericea]